MMDELIRVRCPASEKAGFQAAADRQSLKLSEWMRQAARAKLQDELGVTVGIGHLDHLEVPHRNGDGDGHGNFSFE